MDPSQENGNTRPTTKQTKRTGRAHDQGQQFEIKMAAVIGLRAMQKGDDFELRTNVTDAGKFEDLVYTTNGRRYCLQLKHTENPGTENLTPGELASILEKHFGTYQSMADRDQSEFIIYTNKGLGPKLAKYNTAKADVDTIFKTSDNGKIFKFIPDNNQGSDIYTILEKSLTKRKQCSLSAAPQEDIEDFSNKLIIFTGQKGQGELDDLIAEEIRNHDALKVDPIEYKSILHHFKTPLETWWRNKERENMTPVMLKIWLQRAKTEFHKSLVARLRESHGEKLVRTGMKFSDSEISKLQAELFDRTAENPNKSALHLTSDAPSLCSILLLDCLPQSKCIFVNFEYLYTLKDELLHAWLGGVWQWLIVSCDVTAEQSHISHTCENIWEKHHASATSEKCLITLTHSSAPKMKGFTLIPHKFQFKQLTPESQKIILDKEIDFQGYKVTMRSVLQVHGNGQHVLGPELVTDLVTGETAVNIGGKLHASTGYYAPRVLKRKIWLPLYILRKGDTYPDVFAVSGIEEKELFALVPSDEEVGNFNFHEDYVTGNASQSCMFQNSRFIVLGGRKLKASFSKLHENCSRETLHWLKYKHGELLWKETRGDFRNLMHCIDAKERGIDKTILREFMTRGSCEVTEESIWDLGERTVLVVAEPGMGKSSTTTQVARHTKKRNPTSWVVRINWNDHTNKLQAINAATFNSDSLVEFLCSAAFSDSKYTDINRSLLKQALLSSGNVTVLMDGFDEISPTHADKAAVILSEIKKRKAGRLWVTSRPAMGKTLEKVLCVAAFTLKKLSSESQEEMLQHIWASKGTGSRNDNCLKWYIKVLLSRASELFSPRNFTGFPLHISVLASAFEENLDNFLTCERIGLPEKLDLFSFYDILRRRKLHIYETEKKKEDLTNASVQDDHERLMETYLEDLKKCSLLAIQHPQLSSLHMAIEPTLQSYITRFQAGKDKVGIVMNVVDGKPQFVHRTFAEYFTARWFSENFESNRRVLEDILFSPSYGTVRNVFDRILATDCPLHCAVLHGDTQAVENLLQEGSDVNARDKGGRTAMHLIAAEPHDAHICKEITESLLQHGAFVDATDNVLQWKPLRYAVKAENWFVVERMLGKTSTTTDLELIRQRVDDKSYIGKIIDDIRGKNYNLLFLYLRSISANTKLEA